MTALLVPSGVAKELREEAHAKLVEAKQEPREFEIYRTCDVWRFLRLIQESEAQLVSVHHEQRGSLSGTWVVRYFHDEELSMELHT